MESIKKLEEVDTDTDTEVEIEAEKEYDENERKIHELREAKLKLDNVY